ALPRSLRGQRDRSRRGPGRPVAQTAAGRGFGRRMRAARPGLRGRSRLRRRRNPAARRRARRSRARRRCSSRGAPGPARLRRCAARLRAGGAAGGSRNRHVRLLRCRAERGRRGGGLRRAHGGL
ncbi:MAG: hypothetical protein AVDCRST_MAG53-1028, partial [uncultured Solirubrobacteraceae bacterium]